MKRQSKAEKEGFDSLSVWERILWPLKPQTPYPVSSDVSLPVEDVNATDEIPCPVLAEIK